LDVKVVSKMITDRYLQHELLKTALEATDNYLDVEKKALAAGMATNVMIHDFSYHMARAHDALQSLGVLDQHEKYMQTHVDTMLKLHGHKDATIADLPYAHVPKSDTGEVEESYDIANEAVWDQAKERAKLPKEKLSSASKAKAKARAKAAGRPYPNMVDNIWAARQQEGVVLTFSAFLSEQTSVEEELSEEELNKMVDELTWEDIVDLYDDVELVEEDEDEDENDEKEEVKEEVLDEKLSVQSRLKKRQAFARMRGKRNVARSLKLRRPSNVNVLKKRATLAARRAIYKRFLRGRDKSTLSAAEKDRIEQQVSRMKYIQTSLATRMVSKMRDIEQKRLAGYRAKAAKKMKPSKAPKLKTFKASR
jgi:hypothetical protein